jgi:hypothetical protein
MQTREQSSLLSVNSYPLSGRLSDLPSLKLRHGKQEAFKTAIESDVSDQRSEFAD